MTSREKLIETYNKRQELILQARAILNKADAENRELTKDESREFDKLHIDIQQLRVEPGGLIPLALQSMENRFYDEYGMPTDIMHHGTSGLFGDSVESEWRSRDGRTTRPIGAGESVHGFIEGRDDRAEWNHELARLRPGQVLRALLLGPSNDVEQRALAAGIDTKGGYTVPRELAGRIIDKMRARSVVTRLGARVLPIDRGGELAFARVVDEPTPEWRGENTEVTEAEVTFGSVTARPRSLSMIVRSSRELIEYSPNAESLLETVLAGKMAEEVDRAALFGTGTGHPLGVANWEIAEIEADSSIHYDHVLRARTAMLSKNSEEPNGIVMSPRDEGVLSRAKDGEGRPLPVPPRLQSLRFESTTNVPTDLGGGSDESLAVIGRWQNLLLPTWVSFRVQVLQERYADHLQVGFLCYLAMDTLVEQTDAFAKISKLKPESE